ncbi:MAG: glycosyltransferase [Candidatus Omnitrophica bacterium]|nr:glycosyltransferase [Candidatus Omnitrophota bacterium]MBU1872062.1 glycosyltransferase [Candidatus Omnitrophota bacterium]
MKIIISYASAGSGHRRAAQAIYSYIKEHYPAVDVRIIDVLPYTNFIFSTSYSRGYSFLVMRLKFIWAIIFRITSLKNVSDFIHFICRLNCGRFKNLLIKENPDIVLATHFLPAEVVAYLKEKGRINSRLVTAITDFGLHPLWIYQSCDDYIVGSEHTRDSLIAQGVEESKILMAGIPIDPRFVSVEGRSLRKVQNTPASQAAGLVSAAGFTVLLVTGTFGFVLIDKVVDMLRSEAELIVVCGKNQRLYNRLKRKDYSGVQLFGFTEDMHKLMSQADLLVTKPGGLTIAEAMAMDLPLVFIGSIPGQETENAQILESYGCAINTNNLESLRQVIINFRNNPEKLDLMRANIHRIKNPDATEEICRYIMSNNAGA